MAFSYTHAGTLEPQQFLTPLDEFNALFPNGNADATIMRVQDTDALIAAVDDLLSAPIPEKRKRELLDEAVRQIVWPYKSTAAGRAKLDTGQAAVYSKKNVGKGFGFL